MSYQCIETFRVGYYDLYKKFFFNNTDVLISEEKKKYNDKCLSTLLRLAYGKTGTWDPSATIEKPENQDLEP